LENAPFLVLTLDFVSISVDWVRFRSTERSVTNML